MEIIGKQRKEYLSWDEYFMAIAKLSSYRSKDPSTRVGACIVDNKNRILSIGYNGAPNGFHDNVFPWERVGSMLETKYAFVCHAEMNAILNYRGSRKDLETARIYVDLFPCNECAKLIVQSGIKEVLYLSDKFKNKNGEKVEDSDSVKASKMMFDECGVKYHAIELETSEIKINLQNN